jgi:hypothetical protein
MPKVAAAAAAVAAIRGSRATVAMALSAAAVAADLRVTVVRGWAAPAAMVGRTVMTVNRVKQDKGE